MHVFKVVQCFWQTSHESPLTIREAKAVTWLRHWHSSFLSFSSIRWRIEREIEKVCHVSTISHCLWEQPKGMTDYEEAYGLTIRPWAPFLLLRGAQALSGQLLPPPVKNGFIRFTRDFYRINLPFIDWWAWTRERERKTHLLVDDRHRHGFSFLFSLSPWKGKEGNRMMILFLKIIIEAVNLYFSFRTPSISWLEQLSIRIESDTVPVMERLMGEESTGIWHPEHLSFS